MFILLDADKSVITAKDFIKGDDQIEKVQRTKNGNYTLRDKGHSLLTEHENTPVTRITFVGHSAFEDETGVQCYGGYDANDFADLLIERLKEADKAAGKEQGFSKQLIAIDLIGCVTGYVSPQGKSFAGQVAKKLLAANYDIAVNAFTNLSLEDPQGVYAMVSTPQVAEKKFYIRGFSSLANYEKYERLKLVITEDTKDREAKELDLLELQEQIAKKVQEKKTAEEGVLLTQYKTAPLKAKHRTLKGEISVLTQRLAAQQQTAFSYQALMNSLQSLSDEAKKNKAKGSKHIEQMLKIISDLNAENKSTEKEKTLATFAIIKQTVREIRSGFFMNRRDATAYALQEIIDDRQSEKSFAALKSLLQSSIRMQSIISQNGEIKRQCF